LVEAEKNKDNLDLVWLRDEPKIESLLIYRTLGIQPYEASKPTLKYICLPDDRGRR
jgi:hypothetical protein